MKTKLVKSTNAATCETNSGKLCPYYEAWQCPKKDGVLLCDSDYVYEIINENLQSTEK